MNGQLSHPAWGRMAQGGDAPYFTAPLYTFKGQTWLERGKDEVPGMKSFILFKVPYIEHSVRSSQSLLSKSLGRKAEQSKGTSLWQWRLS